MARRKADKRTPTTPPGTHSTGVPGTYRGFSLQANRFLAHLLKAAPDDTICLEAFDDVGVESPDGRRVAEQAKSFLSKNPLADRSPELWKTLSNWIVAAAAGTLPTSKTRFVLYSHSANALGFVANTLNAANTEEEAAKAISSVKSHLNYPDGLSEDEATRAYMKRVLDAEKVLLARVIVNFTIQTGSLVGTDELVALFSQELISPENRDEVIHWAHGWVKAQIDEQVATGHPCRILQRTFHGALLNYVRTHDRINILKSYAGIPDESAIQNELQYRLYVRQLQAIALDDVDVLAAVNDYLRSAVDRTRWSREGYVTEAAFDALENDLLHVWRNKLLRVAAAHRANSEDERGRILFSDCIDHAMGVDGLETPQHFVRGNWHALADALNIGWHPRFKELFPQVGNVDARHKVESTI